MARTIQHKRGLKADLPTLAQAEFGFCTDAGAEELHIGNGSKNIQVPLVNVYYGDMNELLRSGIYRVGTNDGLPEGLWYGQVLVMQGADSDTVCQIGMGYTDDAIYSRSGLLLESGTYQWRTWKSTSTEELVAKAGDTMTGQLKIHNESEYIGIQKKRTINDVSYATELGVGSDTTKGASASLRLIDSAGSNLGRLDMWADGSITFKSGSGGYEPLARMSYGTTDLTAGTSELATGKLYFVYE